MSLICKQIWWWRRRWWWWCRYSDLVRTLLI